MPLLLHKDLLAGRYRAAADALLDEQRPDSLNGNELASLVGALSFLGRMEEAESLYRNLLRVAAAPLPRAAGRFFLGMGWTRLSSYKRARTLFFAPEAEQARRPLERFYAHQGKAMYAYYTGRYRAAGREATKARNAAIRSGDLFARALAADACGHCRVVSGEIHHGLRLLSEARVLAEKLGNGSLANTIAVSLELYEAEFALRDDALARLEKRRGAPGTEDSYSMGNVGLEIARLYTRNGRFQDAARELERIAPAIYAQQNRRQEIKLNLRLAELACRRGDPFSARQSLRFLDRLLHHEADSAFELSAIGIERKLAEAEGRTLDAKAMTERWQEFARDFGTTRDDNLRVRLGLLGAGSENREDRVHRAIRESRHAASLPARLVPLLESGLLCEAADCAGVPPGQVALALLPRGLGLLVQTGQAIHWIRRPLSALQGRLLRVIAGPEGVSKEKIVEQAWGYRYDPFRHDAMVYAAISSLRKSMGRAGELVQATDSGYRLAAPLLRHSDPEPAPNARGNASQSSPPVPARTRSELPAKVFARLNHRQIETLEWLRSGRRFLSVGEIRERFAVSEVTALRDFDGLLKLGLVVRTGKARATRYSLRDAALLARQVERDWERP